MSFNGNLDHYCFSLPRRNLPSTALLNSTPATRNRCVRRFWRVAFCATTMLGLLASAPLPGATLSRSQGLTARDTELLAEIEKRAVLYFLDHSDPHTGLT